LPIKITVEANSEQYDLDTQRLQLDTLYKITVSAVHIFYGRFQSSNVIKYRRSGELQELSYTRKGKAKVSCNVEGL
jgi:hypothetical protein